MIFSKIGTKLYLIPASLFILMIANGFGVFNDSNIYKTSLLYLSVVILYVLIEWYLIPNFIKNNITVNRLPYVLILLLTIPMIATVPGLLISGGDVNYNIKHEMTIHAAYMFWVSYLVWSLRDRQGVEKFLYVVGGAIIYLVLVGFIGMDITGRDGLITNSTFGNKNYYSNFLILWMPLIFLMVLPLNLGKDRVVEWSTWRRKNSYFAVVFIFAVAGMYQAQTRSAIVGLVGAFSLLGSYFLFLFLKKKYSIRGSYYLAAIVFLALLIPTLFFWIVSQLDEQTVRSSRFLSLATWHGWSPRFVSWQTAMNSIMDAPWFGWGAGSSSSLFFQYVLVDSRFFSDARDYSHVHNEWLEVLQEGGIFGLILFMLPIIIGVYYIKDHLNQKVVLGASSGIIAYLFHGTFSLATRMTINEVSLYTLIAILFISIVRSEKNGQQMSYQDNIAIGRLVRGGGIIVIIFVSIPVLQGSYDYRQVRSENIVTMKESEEQVNRYIETEYIDALHHLAVNQVKRGDVRRLGEVLDRIDYKIPNYRDIYMLRAVNYQLNAGADLDIGKFKQLIMRQWELDRYSPPVLHWLARISAWEKNENEVLQRMGELFQYKVISNRILSKSKVDEVIVKIHNELDGFALVISTDGATLLVGRSVMDSVMEDLRQINSQEESNMVYKRYVKKVYLKMTEDGFTEVEIVKIKGLLEKVLSRLASWSQVPDR